MSSNNYNYSIEALQQLDPLAEDQDGSASIGPTTELVYTPDFGSIFPTNNPQITPLPGPSPVTHTQTCSNISPDMPSPSNEYLNFNHQRPNTLPPMQRQATSQQQPAFTAVHNNVLLNSLLSSNNYTNRMTNQVTGVPIQLHRLGASVTVANNTLNSSYDNQASHHNDTRTPPNQYRAYIPPQVPGSMSQCPQPSSLTSQPATHFPNDHVRQRMRLYVNNRPTSRPNILTRGSPPIVTGTYREPIDNHTIINNNVINNCCARVPTANPDGTTWNPTPRSGPTIFYRTIEPTAANQTHQTLHNTSSNLTRHDRHASKHAQPTLPQSYQSSQVTSNPAPCRPRLMAPRVHFPTQPPNAPSVSPRLVNQAQPRMQTPTSLAYSTATSQTLCITQTPVSVSSTTRSTGTSVPPVEALVKLVTLNKACQVNRHVEMVHRSASIVPERADKECQTDFAESGTQTNKNYVDRASSPIFVTFPTKFKQTPKRRKVRAPSPSSDTESDTEPNCKSAPSPASEPDSDDEINVIE